MDDYKFALQPNQNLWAKVKAGDINETDVDSYGRLIKAFKKDLTTESIISRYEDLLRKIDKQEVIPSKDHRYELKKKRKSKLDEISYRLDELDRQISSIIQSLRQHNIYIRNIYDTFQ